MAMIFSWYAHWITVARIAPHLVVFQVVFI